MHTYESASKGSYRELISLHLVIILRSKVRVIRHSRYYLINLKETE